MSSCRCRYVDMTAWMVAATGSARNAPSAPNTAPNAMTTTNATAGFISSAFSEIFGAKR